MAGGQLPAAPQRGPERSGQVLRSTVDQYCSVHRYGLTVLHHAVYRDNVALVGRLLGERGVRPGERDVQVGAVVRSSIFPAVQGNTALHLAALGTNAVLISSLLESIDLTLTNREGQTALHTAAGTGQVALPHLPPFSLCVAGGWSGRPPDEPPGGGDPEPGGPGGQDAAADRGQQRQHGGRLPPAGQRRLQQDPQRAGRVRAPLLRQVRARRRCQAAG